MERAPSRAEVAGDAALAAAGAAGRQLAGGVQGGAPGGAQLAAPQHQLPNPFYPPSLILHGRRQSEPALPTVSTAHVITLARSASVPSSWQGPQSHARPPPPLLSPGHSSDNIWYTCEGGTACMARLWPSGQDIQRMLSGGGGIPRQAPHPPRPSSSCLPSTTWSEPRDGYKEAPDGYHEPHGNGYIEFHGLQVPRNDGHFELHGHREPRRAKLHEDSDVIVEGFRCDYIGSPSSSLSRSLSTQDSDRHEAPSVAGSDRHEAFWVAGSHREAPDEQGTGSYDEQLGWFNLVEVSEGNEADEPTAAQAQNNPNPEPRGIPASCLTAEDDPSGK